MQSNSEQVAAIVAELEQENDGLRKHIEYLRGVIERGVGAVMAPESGVFILLPPPPKVAFGQRWALVFTIEPNTPAKPSINDVCCQLHQAGGKSEGYLPIYDMPFGSDELPKHAFYLGMATAKAGE
jgi:hypothetical protein